MRRSFVAALLLGALNAVVAVATLALVDAVTPDAFGWFSYAATLEEAVVQDPRFPWQYVAVPVALLFTNTLAVPLFLRRADSSAQVRPAHGPAVSPPR